MNYRRFGKTDLVVSEICFGPMRFSAKTPSTDVASQTGQKALARALERGVNFIHSSYEYGTRWAIGEVLKDHPKRHELHHIIKVPVPGFKDGDRFDPAAFRRIIEEALQDLHTDCIDVVQHLLRSDPNTDERRIPNISVVDGPLREVFEKLKNEGKVKHLATFPYTPGFARESLETGAFSGLVAFYNLIEMAMAEFFQQMEDQGQGFFCIRPLMAGLLTDRRSNRADLPEGDRFLDTEWDDPYRRLEQLDLVFSGEVESWTSFAVKFALCHPVVTSLIIGLNSPEQVDEVIDAADGKYPDRSDFDKALELFQREGTSQ
jgi:aryl-alcohol dehydrogenase-like predicted oxidoreductase